MQAAYDECVQGRSQGGMGVRGVRTTPSPLFLGHTDIYDIFCHFCVACFQHLPCRLLIIKWLNMPLFINPFFSFIMLLRNFTSNSLTFKIVT